MNHWLSLVQSEPWWFVLDSLGDMVCDSVLHCYHQVCSTVLQRIVRWWLFASFPLFPFLKYSLRTLIYSLHRFLFREGGDVIQPLVSVVIPAHNEAQNLATLLDELDLSLQAAGYAHEILVMDDGSSDESWSLLGSRAEQQPTLRPMRHQRSAGQSTSIWQAVHLARGEWIITLDGDGQNDPADIPVLLERALKDDVTLVAGHRIQRHDDWVKRFSSRLANRVRGALLKDNTPDTGCALKVFRRDAFVRLPYFDHMHRFLPALILSQGGSCVSMPVSHRPRQAGQSHYGIKNRLWAGLLDISGVMWLRYRSRLPAEVVEHTAIETPFTVRQSVAEND